jgi:hypothetical protein
MNRLFFSFIIFLFARGSAAQVGPAPSNFENKFDFPEISVFYTVPQGVFGRTSLSNPNAGFASPGLGISFAYHANFSSSAFGLHFSLSAAYNRFTKYDELIRSENANSSGPAATTESSRYFFLPFLMGPTFQTHQGEIDFYLRAVAGPVYSKIGDVVIEFPNGSASSIVHPGVFSLGRGVEGGFIFYNRFRLGVAYYHYGEPSYNITGANSIPQIYELFSPPIEMVVIRLGWTFRDSVSKDK